MVFDSLPCTQPMKIAQKRSDMVVLPGREIQSSRCVHDRLKSIEWLMRLIRIKNCAAVGQPRQHRWDDERVQYRPDWWLTDGCWEFDVGRQDSSIRFGNYSIEMSESTFLPRSQTEWTGMIMTVPTGTGATGIRCWRRSDAQRSTSVLSAFNCSRLAGIHDVTSSAHSDKRNCNLAVAFGLKNPYVCLSSA